MDKDTCDEAADKFSIITNLSPLKPSERRIQTTSKEDYNEREENATCNREFIRTEDDMDGSKFSAGVIPTDSHLIYKSEKEPILRTEDDMDGSKFSAGVIPTVLIYKSSPFFSPTATFMQMIQQLYYVKWIKIHVTKQQTNLV